MISCDGRVSHYSISDYFKLVFRETFEIVCTHHRYFKRTLVFFCRAKSNLDSLACSLDPKISEMQPGPSGLRFCFYPRYQQFLKPKIPLALKFIQVFSGKIIALKQKSTVVNKFTCNRKSPLVKFTTVTAPNAKVRFTCMKYQGVQFLFFLIFSYFLSLFLFLNCISVSVHTGSSCPLTTQAR